jgi:DNA invertase Pin-like site-specific DNA recombinase
MFQMCGVFAEFERAMIVERVNSGLARAKAKGVKLARGNKKDGDRSADEQRSGMSMPSWKSASCDFTRVAPAY